MYILFFIAHDWMGQTTTEQGKLYMFIISKYVSVGMMQTYVDMYVFSPPKPTFIHHCSLVRQPEQEQNGQ